MANYGNPGGGWHTGSLNPGTGGVRDGYKPNLGSVAQAEFESDLEQEAATAGKGRFARLRRALRRFLWEF